ncbi:MAG: hypothetical protein RMN51_11005 [Verrucomicrobiota bacterium]|nr:hypothetical protein [Limisphaera sp.]MDW8382616.1 hypothetical protein [Verrucomicrobiota bacterium]
MRLVFVKPGGSQGPRDVRRAFVSRSPETLVYDWDGDWVQDGRWRY